MENDKGESMFIILSGMVGVQRNLDGDKILDIARLSTYDYFGEMSLMTGEARSASVLAHTECQVLEITKQSFQPLMISRPKLNAEIAEIMAERKLKSELMTAELKHISISDRLKNYTDSFINTIRLFFRN